MNIIAAINPRMFDDDYTIIFVKVWFEEFEHPLDDYVATIFDCEVHSRELWFRAMKGEYGPIEIIQKESKTVEIIEPPRMLTYDISHR